MEFSIRPSLINNIVCRPENDGAFLFDPESGNITYINHTALEVYRLIDGERDISAIFDIFEQRYPEIDSVQLKADITAIFDSLDENQFITTR
jgi:hypothetical protein